MQIELNYPDPLPLELDAGKTLLLIVDMENEDAHPLGQALRWRRGDSHHPKYRAVAAQGATSRRIRSSHSICAQTRRAGIYHVQ